MFNLQTIATIVIPEGDVQKITDSQGNILWQKADAIILPYNPDKSDADPVTVYTVAAGDIITITYYPTASGGVLYDASNCGGSSYQITASELNSVQTKTITASKAGKLIIGGTYQYYSWGMDWPGSLGMNPPYCKYIKITIN